MKIFLLFFFLLASNADIVEIDAKIQELTEMKRGYEARALRHENQAERLQFEDKAFLEARRHIELAQENRQKAAVIQEQIDQLQEKKETLLRKMGTRKVASVECAL